MQSTPDQIKSTLFSHINKGIKYDLDRMFKASSLCGDPHKSYFSVHVAGTNGKGSTCAYIESVLRRAGYKTGLYTSPHITNFEERFRIDGVDINEDAWFGVYKDQEKVINDLGLTFFEAATLMAFEIFKRAGVQYAIFETGMGGRLDATNIITPKVSVITKLALDHCEYLGDTLEAIAAEKLGIVKRGAPLVMLEPDDRRIRELAVEKCKEIGSDLVFSPVDMGVTGVVCRDDGVSFCLDGRKYDLSMIGEYQVQNAVLAMNALRRVDDFDYQVVYEGIKSAVLPGRFQIVDVSDQQLVIDVGHNPDAAEALVGALKRRFPDRRVSFVLGMMRDKDIDAVLKILAPRASAFYFTRPKTERAADPYGMMGLTDGKFSGRRVVIEDVAEAVSAALRDAAGSVDTIVCVTGSFYTVSEASTQIYSR
ncbi:MAG: bifunctional folylpolyglutamate synthase/dihydrofolate synthase [Chitinispirillales bacterium]|jgi:dihydrofolate synthase/folylpolyglutamate synthase|nr:bifunctional folylpolyglutamate synthase/dihydrofolate synthase [Chitinispirillales bacterium]